MKTGKFDTKVQYLKYKVLREVARHEWEGNLFKSISDIPKEVSPGKVATMRCCIYKERAILAERVKIAMGATRDDGQMIQVIDIACDECPAGGYVVTPTCRGCLAHRCSEVCPKDAIYFDRHQKAIIDKDLCINCGRCAQVCSFGAIIDLKRPCENACKVKAISEGEDKAAKIDYEKCISCGACVYQCPFGAITDKSFILDVVRMIKESEGNSRYNVYAVVAPSISTQFKYAKNGQVIAAMKQLGFYRVTEAALGADMVADAEARELVEKGFLTSSCCPAFVDFIHKQFPQMVQHISHNLSPMATISKYIKEHDETAKVVFIGPCTAKKMEILKEEVSPYVDAVLTFEELQALIDSKEIPITELEEDTLDEASYFGRIFARSGGLSDAIVQGLREHGHNSDDYSIVACEGIESCRTALLLASKGKSNTNFIEGMACVQGCIGGAGCLTHGEKNKAEIDRYGKEATDQSISDAIRDL